MFVLESPPTPLSNLRAIVLADYASQLIRQPVLTNAVTSAFVMLAGDRLAQHLEGHKQQPKASWARSGVLMSFSSLIASPFFTKFWGVLELRIPGRTLAAAVGKAAMTALVATPIMNAAFFTYTTTMEHVILPEEAAAMADGTMRQPQPLKAKLRQTFEEKYLETVKMSAMVWIPLNTANFALVPPHMRVLVSQMAAVLWAAFLSIVAHRKPADLQEQGG
jgi:protein Mpv17